MKEGLDESTNAWRSSRSVLAPLPAGVPIAELHPRLPQPRGVGTGVPTIDPTTDPSPNPTIDPTPESSVAPTLNPSIDPTMNPSVDPTMNPSIDPTTNPSIDPTTNPSVDPTMNPSFGASIPPTVGGTVNPTPTRTATRAGGTPSRSPSGTPSATPPAICDRAPPFGALDAVCIDNVWQLIFAETVSGNASGNASATTPTPTASYDGNTTVSNRVFVQGSLSLLESSVVSFDSIQAADASTGGSTSGTVVVNGTLSLRGTVVVRPPRGTQNGTEFVLFTALQGLNNSAALMLDDSDLALDDCEEGVRAAKCEVPSADWGGKRVKGKS